MAELTLHYTDLPPRSADSQTNGCVDAWLTRQPDSAWLAGWLGHAWEREGEGEVVRGHAPGVRFSLLPQVERVPELSTGGLTAV